MADNITYKDISDVKESFEKEIKECRHWCKNSVQALHFDIDNNKTEVALLKQSHTTMTEKFQEMKSEMKSEMKYWFEKLELLFADSKKENEKIYATKGELKLRDARINLMYWFFWTTWWLVIAWLIWKFLELI